jgi:peroxisomal 2,4-dienoyl-CoA reductase
VRNIAAVKNAVDQAMKRFGSIDILVNGAAGNFLARVADISPNAFSSVIDIDLKVTHAPRRVCARVRRSHLKRERSISRVQFSMQCKDARFAHTHALAIARWEFAQWNIINISAMLHFGATHWVAHASAAKAGVDSLTRSMALEWGPLVRVNGIAPGPIASTEGMKRLSNNRSEDADVDVAQFGPAQRMGNVTDIALAAVFLASEETASYISGITLAVDGGHHLYKVTNTQTKSGLCWSTQQPMVPEIVVQGLAESRKAKMWMLRNEMKKKFRFFVLVFQICA